MAAPRVPAKVVEILSRFGRVTRDTTDLDSFAGTAIYVCTAVDPVTSVMIDAWQDRVGLIANIGFDMSVLYHGPRRKGDAEQSLGARYCRTLSELLAVSDVVSLHCELNADTRHLMNAATLAQMKPGSVLVNTGRGALVDEEALFGALASGHLGGAGLDVFEHEPDIHPSLLDFDNVTVLPHAGSATVECQRDMVMRVADNISAWLETGNVPDACGTTAERKTR